MRALRAALVATLALLFLVPAGAALGRVTKVVGASG